MSGVVALRCALEEDLSALVALLRQAGMPHRVSEEAGMQVLRVPDERCAALVQQWYRELPVNDVAESHAVPLLQPRRWWQDGLHALCQQPVTLGVLLLALVVAVLSGLGEQRTVVSWLTFTSVVEKDGQLWLLYLPDTLERGDWWRLLSPILLHFSLLHLVMNSLWYWELGRRIEWQQGRLWLLGFTLGFGLLSNLAQYLVEGPGVFGGLSGVLYGLLGHCWLFNRLAPTPLYQLPPGTVALMLGWMLFCLTGFTATIGLGTIANAAHVGGLVAGCITGVIGGLLARRR